ncbi:MAG: hypothetical protein J7M21_05860, partial [Planctomycetes bacterium]|nr:hypothetical protein [Planctomycetota bacterium]
MSASSEPARPAGPRRRGRASRGSRWADALAGAWRPAGLLYLAACLAGLAVGLWPQSIWPSRAEVPAAPLPTLAALAVAQVLFILLAHPIVLLPRSEAGIRPGFWTGAVAESLAWLLVTLPLYAAAA